MKKSKSNIKLQLCLQKASSIKNYPLPKRAEFMTWIKLALQVANYANHLPIEISLRLTDTAESASFNQQYRHKARPTNILSFPTENPPESGFCYLGDLLICVPLVIQEANEQNKPVPAHWAHLTIHGVLHLLGYDHVAEDEAMVMEELETVALKQLGYANPYLSF